MRLCTCTPTGDGLCGACSWRRTQPCTGKYEPCLPPAAQGSTSHTAQQYMAVQNMCCTQQLCATLQHEQKASWPCSGGFAGRWCRGLCLRTHSGGATTLSKALQHERLVCQATSASSHCSVSHSFSCLGACSPISCVMTTDTHLSSGGNAHVACGDVHLRPSPFARMTATQLCVWVDPGCVCMSGCNCGHVPPA